MNSTIQMEQEQQIAYYTSSLHIHTVVYLYSARVYAGT